MDTTFRVGNRVTNSKVCGSTENDGTIYTVFKSDSGELAISGSGEDDDVCTCQDCWTRVGGGKGKTDAPYKFILQYLLDRDPVELFRTMAEVKKRVVQLAENNRSLKKDSLRVYEIKGLPKVIKISTAVRVGR